MRLRDNNLEPEEVFLQDVSAGSPVVCVLRDCYGGHSVGETPGPIPNPEAKAHCADGTALVRVWESRSPPDLT